MVNSKTGGGSASVSALNALPPPKPVTSFKLQQAKESAIESKKRMLSIRPTVGNYVVKMTAGATSTNKARMLTKEEVQSLRDTKRQVADHVKREFGVRNK